MIEKLFLIALIILAFISLSTPRMRLAIIYKSLFSLVCAFIFLYYSAPDVAIAEAVIGCGITTALFLVALRNAEHFSVYILMPDTPILKEDALIDEAKSFLLDIHEFSKQKGLNLDIRYSNVTFDTMLNEYRADLVLVQKDGEITLYGLEQDYHFDAVEEIVTNHKDRYSYKFIRLHETANIMHREVDNGA